MIYLDRWLLRSLLRSVAAVWLLLAVLAGGVDLAAQVKPLLRNELGWATWWQRGWSLLGGCALPAGVLGTAIWWIQLHNSGEAQGLGSVGYSHRRVLLLLTTAGLGWAFLLHVGRLPLSLHLPSPPQAWVIDGGVLAVQRSSADCRTLLQPAALMWEGNSQDRAEILASVAQWRGSSWHLKDGRHVYLGISQPLLNQSWPPPESLCPPPAGTSLQAGLVTAPLALLLGWNVVLWAGQRVWAQILGGVAGCGFVAVLMAWLEKIRP